MQRSILDGAWAAGPIQLDDDAHTGLDDAQVRAAAGHGISGSGQQLPFLDQIQRSFGAHDVGGVRAHFGDAPREANAALGANAYATGNDVAFATDSPSLHLAAHEAAHVVQQRSGVSLQSAVGQAGDSYESHADAVADHVVRGESAEALLGEIGGGAAVQRDKKDKKDKKKGTAEAAPAKPEAKPEAIGPIIDHWEDMNLLAARSHRDWATANWAMFLAKTAPQAYSPMGESAYKTFLSGVWGNLWTDAPDALFDLAGFGVADAAKNAATKAVVGEIVGEVVEAGLQAAGALAGGAVGLLVSSALATMVEMAYDALVKGPDEANAKVAAGATLSVEQTTAILVDLMLNCDVAEDRAGTEARRLRALAEKLSPAGITDLGNALWNGIAEVGSQLVPASDRSLYRELMRDWVLTNAKSPTSPKDSTVQSENWQAAAKDESIMGEGGLEGLTGKRDPNPFAKPGNKTGGIDAWYVNNLREHQARMALAGAGLATEEVVAALAVSKPLKTQRFTLEAVDRPRYEAFVVRNWGADPEELDGRARVEIDCERVHERNGGFLSPRSDHIVDIVREIRIAPMAKPVAAASTSAPEPELQATRKNQRYLEAKPFHPAAE